jgi:hypothetical protein
MKKVVQVTEVDGEGLVALLGKHILVFCMNYINTGELEGVNTTCILLKDASIVYETGPFTDKKFGDAQEIGNLYIQTNSIESFGETDKR